MVLPAPVVPDPPQRGAMRGGGDEIAGGPDSFRASRRSAGSPRSRGESKAKPEESEPGRKIAPIPAADRRHLTGGRS